MPDAIKVGRLLIDSTAAHRQYQQSKRQGQASQARNFLALAASKRREAVNEDPTLSAPIWKELDTQYPHSDLLLFYARELAK